CVLPGYRADAIAFSPDGRLLVSGSNDGMIRLWDSLTAKQLDEIKAHSDWVVAVAISPDGKTVASGGKDGRVRLWEVSTRKLRAEYGKTGHGGVNCVAFSCAGLYLATGTTLATVQVWDLAKAKEYRSLVGHEGAISSVNFSPDGHEL